MNRYERLLPGPVSSAFKVENHPCWKIKQKADAANQTERNPCIWVSSVDAGMSACCKVFIIFVLLIS